MEWCVDTGKSGTLEVAARDMRAFFERRGVLPGAAAEAAARTAEELQRRYPSRRLRLRLGWRGPEIELAVHELAAEEGALPGVELAPGATSCPWFDGGATAPLPEALVHLELGVFRPKEFSIDPDPGEESVPADKAGFLAAAAAIGSRLTAYGAEGRAAVIGAASARHAERRHREATGLPSLSDATQVAEAFANFQREIGGDFEVLEADASTAVVANRTCPFGPSITTAPHLCRVTSAMLGSMAARASGRARVLPYQTLASGDQCCRFEVDLKPDDEPGGHLYTWPPSGVPVESDHGDTLGQAAGHGISMSLQLPRDRMSVPVIRHLARYALREVGVDEDAIFDIELALSEACTNVIAHSGPGDAYEVAVSIKAESCELRITDTGRGFDHVTVREHRAGQDAERGRGMALMQTVMDRVDFVSVPERGTLVTLVKRLTFDESSPVRLLLAEATKQEQQSGPPPA